MATLNANLILQQTQFKPPSTDFSDALVSAARIRAYEQQRRLEELKYGQLERSQAKDEAFDQLAAGLFTAPQAQPAAGQRGLAAGPPQAPPGMPPGGSPGMAPGGMPPGIPQPTSMEPGAFTMAQGGGPGVPPPQVPGGMPPGIPAPTSMEPGTFTMAQGTPPPAAPVAPRSLADAAPWVMPPAAQEPPAGLGGAQPGAPTSLLQPLNEEVLMRLYAANPEKASKLMEGHLKMQTSKLEQAEKMNDQIYQVLSAVERSPDPAAMYPEAITSLKERGIPIPASFPRQYNPALVRFKLQEHETLKNRIDLSTIDLNQWKAKKEKADADYHIAKTGVIPSEIEANKALAGQRGAAAGLDRARTGMVPTQIDAERALAEQRRAQAALDKARQTGIPADIEAAQALTNQRKAEAELTQARIKGVPAEIQAAEALVEQRKAEAARIPLQGQEDVARTKKLQEETTNLINERKAKAGQVTPYTTDSDWNVYLSQAMKEAGFPPGTSPNDHPAVIAKARQYQTEDKQKVARDVGLSAVERAQGPAATKRLEASNAKGSSAEQVMNVLDEVDRLIDEGVYENVPEEKAKQVLFLAGLRPDDAKAARTKRLYELGNQLTVGMAPNGSLGTGMSEGDRQTFERAGGDLQKNQSALSRKETIKSMRTLGKINMHDANQTWETHSKTGDFPRFGSAREERLKILTPARLEEAYQGKKAQGWTKEQIRAELLKQGFREE